MEKSIIKCCFVELIGVNIMKGLSVTHRHSLFVIWVYGRRPRSEKPLDTFFPHLALGKSRHQRILNQTPSKHAKKGREKIKLP